MGFVTIMYLLTGAIAGFFSGLLGIGGGLVTVPALVYVFHLNVVFPDAAVMHRAIGTSFVIMFCTSLFSAWSHARHHMVSWVHVQRLMLGTCFGVLGGLYVGRLLSGAYLRTLFGVFLIFLAFDLLWGLFKPRSESRALLQSPQKSEVWGSSWALMLIGLSIGLLSGVLGVGGGFLMVPLLLKSGESIRSASGTAVMCILPTSLMGTVSSLLSTPTWSSTAHLPMGVMGYVYWPAVLWVTVASFFFIRLGVYFCKISSESVLKSLFAGLMLVVGVSLWY